MCIKAGDNELDSVKNLMAMSLRVIVAEALHAEIEDIDETSRLRDDLGMDAAGSAELLALVAEYFDGLGPDLEQLTTFGDLLEVVVLNEFRDVEVRSGDCPNCQKAA